MFKVGAATRVWVFQLRSPALTVSCMAGCSLPAWL